jgi:hypothetical protein
MWRRRAPKRVAVRNVDRLVFAGPYRLAPEVLDAAKILKPETVIRWHRAGFRARWPWKSRPRGGRPRTPDDVCQLIRERSVANPPWDAPRIRPAERPTDALGCRASHARRDWSSSGSQGSRRGRNRRSAGHDPAWYRKLVARKFSSLAAVKAWCRTNRHRLAREQRAWLSAVLNGHYAH